MPEYADIAFAVVLLLFTASGFLQGFVRTLGNFVGLILGIIVAGYAVFWIDAQFGLTSQPILALTLFLVIAALVSRIVKWVTFVIDGLREMISIIPFFSLINRILGGVLGAAQGAFLIIAFVYVTNTYVPDGQVKEFVTESYTAGIAEKVPEAVSWVFPEIKGILGEEDEK